MAFLQINSNTKFYYELLGSGAPIVFISGHRGDNLSWHLIAPHFADKFQVLCFDNLASGLTTDDNKPLSIEIMADAVWELITKLSLPNSTIVGESMGGAIAQVIANKYGDKINKLIIINSAAKFNQATLMNLEAQLKLRGEDIPFELSFQLRLPWIFSAEFLANQDKVENFRKFILSNPIILSIENQARQLNAIKDFDSRPWAKNINVPTKVISAKNDIVVLSSEAKLLSDLIPNAEFITISGGHGSPFQSPQEIITIIDKVLNN